MSAPSAAGPAELVRLAGVTRRFGDGPPALDAVSGTIEAGAITGIVGPDGAGKTTLIRLMAGLLLPDVGTVEVLGHDARTGQAGIHAGIGYMPQRFGLYEDLSVQENLDLHASLRGVPTADRAEVFARLLALTDLGRFTDRMAGKLSGGMKQKLGLACALMGRPRLLLLDEPSVGVDPISRRELWRMVGDLARQGIGIVWSTAYLDEAEACDRVLVLDGGRLLFAGDPEGLTARVADRVFRLSGFEGRRRAVLGRALAHPGIVDGVVQGDAIRLVVRDRSVLPAVIADAGPGTAALPARPRFEDAFVDMLGGGPGAGSALAEASRFLPRDDARPVIDARGLTRRFGDFTAVDDVTFEIPRGQIFGLLGPNGAGKSTTFRMLCGLLKPSGGDARIAGYDLRRQSAAARSRIGYMAQKFSLYDDLTVAQNLDFFAGVYGLTGDHRRRRIELVSGIFDLGPRARHPARDLPLGVKQRLALACAVMHEPEVLFLDEPTSGVDPITRREFWAHINALVEKGVTVLVTTHFMDEAEYCDRIALIYRGRAIALGSPEDLRRSAAGPDLPDPTMEDAFIALVEASGRREAA
jgi:ABC-2 type transport system ATP-binding protein